MPKLALTAETRYILWVDYGCDGWCPSGTAKTWADVEQLYNAIRSVAGREVLVTEYVPVKLVDARKEPEPQNAPEARVVPFPREMYDQYLCHEAQRQAEQARLLKPVPPPVDKRCA